MTFWFAPFSDLIKKKVCRYLLHRYLGSFIDEKISLDQLNVDFYNGKGTISDITLSSQVGSYKYVSVICCFIFVICWQNQRTFVMIETNNNRRKLSWNPP